MIVVSNCVKVPRLEDLAVLTLSCLFESKASALFCTIFTCTEAQNRTWIFPNVKRLCFVFQHLFALRSKHKGHDRTYYLAAETDSDMTKWVQCLCNVCGCKPVPNGDDGTFCGCISNHSFICGCISNHGFVCGCISNHGFVGGCISNQGFICGCVSNHGFMCGCISNHGFNWFHVFNACRCRFPSLCFIIQ